MTVLLLAAALTAFLVIAPQPAPRAPPSAGPLRSAAGPGPAILDVTPDDGQWISSTSPVIVVLYAELNPTAEIDQVRFSLDGVGFDTTGLFNESVFQLLVPFDLGNGPHTAQVTVFDNTTANATLAWSFTVFAVAPILVVTQPVYPFVNVTGVLVAGTVAPPAAYPQLLPLQVSIAPRPGVGTFPALVAADGSFSLTVPLAVGANVVFVNGTDAIGNTVTVVKTVVVDTTPPPLTVLTPANLTTVLGRSVVHVSGMTEFGVSLSVNNVSVAVFPTGSWSVDLALPDGVNLVTVVAADLAGNLNVVVKVVIVDTDVPQVLLTSPLVPITNRGQVLVSGFATDANLYALLVNGEATPVDAATGAFSRTLTLPDGTWPIVVVAVDIAGHRGVAQTGILVDTTPPAVRVTDPPNGLETNQSSVLVRGTVDDANATILVDGGQIRPNADGTWQTTVAALAGANVITVSAMDLAGNRAAPVRLTVTYYPASPGLDNRISQLQRDLSMAATTMELGLVAVLLVLLVAVTLVYLRMDRRLVSLRGKGPRKPPEAPPKAPLPKPPEAPPKKET